jgi:hypothetical protein
VKPDAFWGVSFVWLDLDCMIMVSDSRQHAALGYDFGPFGDVASCISSLEGFPCL